MVNPRTKTYSKKVESLTVLVSADGSKGLGTIDLRSGYDTRNVSSLAGNRPHQSKTLNINIRLALGRQ